MSSGKSQSGYTYLSALLLIATLGTGLAAIGELWSQSRQREKELELRWVGEQFKLAIGTYYQRSTGNPKRYPPSLEDLLADPRSLTTQRYLRKVYSDPLTGKAEWGLVPGPGGGVKGVYSLSERPLLRKTTDADRAKDLKFVYEPPA